MTDQPVIPGAPDDQAPGADDQAADAAQDDAAPSDADKLQQAHDAAHAALTDAQTVDQATPGQPAVRGIVAKLEEVLTVLRDLIG